MAIAFATGVVKNATASPAATTGLSPVAGNLIVVYMGMDAGSNTITGVSDNKGNTYVQIPGMSLSGASGGATLDAWYTVVTIPGASFTINVAFNAATSNMNVIAQLFTGFIGTPTLDKVKSTDNASAVTTMTSGATAATTRAVELVVGGAVHTSTVSAFSLGAGYTNLTQSSIAARQAAMESLVTSATGAQTATFGIAAARTGVAGVATFYDAGAVSTPNSNFLMLM